MLITRYQKNSRVCMTMILPTVLYLVINRYACNRHILDVVTTIDPDECQYIFSETDSYPNVYIANLYYHHTGILPTTVMTLSINKFSIDTLLPTFPLFLKYLNIRNSTIEYFPELPDTIIALELYYVNIFNKVTIKLPSKLERLNFQHVHGIRIESTLPDTLVRFLYIDYDIQINKLPPYLNKLSCVLGTIIRTDPSTLITTGITSFPSTLLSIVLYETCPDTIIPSFPLSLIALNISGDNIKCLPELPHSLKTLYVCITEIKRIPVLPPTLIRLEVFRCEKLNYLPELPSTLEYLNCTGSGIMKLPILPSSLIKLKCGSTKLTHIPNLPNGFKMLDCSHNDIDELPELPSSMTELYCNSSLLLHIRRLPPLMEYTFSDED